MRSQTYTIRFLFRKKVAFETYTFYFDRPNKFTFISGQYNRWTLPITTNDDKGSSRFFTISSSPNDKDKISFTTRIGTSEFKKALLRLKPNDKITIFGPMGQFLINEEELKPKIFLAGGMGITPFISFLIAKPTTPIILIASFKTPQAVINLEQSPLIKIIYTITNATKSDQWQGEKGRISEALIKKYVPMFENSLFYITGSTSMVDDTKILINKLGIQDNKIRSESY